MEFYYDGALRFDVLFDNPNKTGVLIFEIIISLFLFYGKKKKLDYVLIPLILFLGYLLMETYSRGAILAFGFSIIIILYGLFQTTDRQKIYPIIICVIVLAIFFCFHSLSLRVSEALTMTDASVTNRLKVWQNGLSMILDAPGGWGWGSSGKSYLQWYQPYEDTEIYRTMVSSHMTFMVELSWFFRYIYILLWTLCFGVALPEKHTPASYVIFSLMAGFFITGIFSSVYEELILWIIPLGCLTFSIYVGNYLSRIKKLLHVSVLLLVAMIVFCIILRNDSNISKVGNYIRVGDGGCNYLFVVDRRVMGSFYGKKIRQLHQSMIGKSFWVVHGGGNLPREINISKIILAGEPELEFTAHQLTVKEIILLNPSDSFLYQMEKLENNYAIYMGEYSLISTDAEWKNYSPVLLEGVGDYIPDWGKFIRN